jgi:aspartyl/asparaginyl beta-hydroxylase (cupin superfamily)
VSEIDADLLNEQGLHALKAGDAATARALLDRAAAADPNSPLSWFHVALACRAQGDVVAEKAAVERSLALDPRFYLALLHKATYFERQQKPKHAARAYAAFLDCVPPSAQQLPALQQALQRAREAIAHNNAALDSFIQARLPAQTAEDPALRLRFDHCLDIFLGRRKVFTPQPTFTHFPHLPAIEFYDRRGFPWLDEFEANTDTMRSELIQVLSEDANGIVPYVNYPSGVPLDQWVNLNRSRSWGAYYLIKDGVGIEAHLARCPKTAALLAAAPLADVPGQAPTAFFSLLDPKTHIPPHTGVTNTRLVVHVPLIVPRSCRFRVGAESREWQAGKAWVFDDTIEHEAWNDSDEPRAILIIDIWNPFLTLTERALVRAATVAIAEFNRE